MRHLRLAKGWKRRASRLHSRVENRIATSRQPAWPPGPRSAAPSTTLISVNFNTLELTAMMLFSLFRVTRPHSVQRVIVVDNRSTDGSREVLREVAHAGLICLIENRWQRYHGPALSQGVRRAHADHVGGVARTDRLVTLDSDAFVLRPDAFDVLGRALDREGAAVAGELLVGMGMPDGYAHVAALMLDPRQAVSPDLPPFLEHGHPGLPMQLALRETGATIVDVPVFTGGYIFHLWQGTLATIVDGKRNWNAHYQWAADNLSRPRLDLRQLAEPVRQLRSHLRAEAPDLTGPELVAALERPDRIQLDE